MIFLVVLLPLVTQAMNLAGFAFGRALGHHPEVTHALVLAGAGVAQVAGDALIADGVDAGGVGEGHEADRVFVLFHVQLLEAVGGLGRRRSGRSSGFAEEDVLEGVLGTGGAVALEQVDRAGDLRARHFAPVVDPAR